LGITGVPEQHGEYRFKLEVALPDCAEIDLTLIPEAT